MSDSEFFGDAVERLEWDERKEDDSPYKRLRQFSRRTALTGGAAGIAAMVLEACGSSSLEFEPGNGQRHGRERRRQCRLGDLRLGPELQVHLRQPCDG